jgi:ferredoxin-NADP reductase
LPAIAPGQYVSVFVDLPDGDRQPRQYTVSSTAVRTRLQITVLRVRGVNGAPDGRVSSYLHDQVQVGDILDVSAPAGDFVLTPTESPLLLASAGAGITTVLPIVEHIARTQPQRKVIVAHADRRAQDHALRDTVLHLGREIDDFTSYTWYEEVNEGDTRSVRATSTCPTSRSQKISRSSRAARCRSCGLSGRPCSTAACRRLESAMKSSGPTSGLPKPRLTREVDDDSWSC